MRRPNRLRLVLLLLALSISVSPAGAGQHAESQWVSVSPPADGFTVLLPEQPKLETEQYPMMGNNYEMRMYTSVEQKSGFLFMVVVQNLPTVTGALSPSVKLDKFMEGFKEGFTKSTPNAPFEIKYERDLALKGNFGKQYSISYAETRGLARVYDNPGRVYLLLTMGGNEDHPSVARFFNSFSLQNAAAPPPRSPGF